MHTSIGSYGEYTFDVAYEKRVGKNTPQEELDFQKRRFDEAIQGMEVDKVGNVYMYNIKKESMIQGMRKYWAYQSFLKTLKLPYYDIYGRYYVYDATTWWGYKATNWADEAQFN